MKLKSKDDTTVFIFILLLCSWGLMQTGMKSMPQIVLITFGFSTFCLSQLKNKTPFKTLFYLLLGVVLFASIFHLIILIMDVFLPNRGMVAIDGELYATNGDPYLFLELILSGILSFILLVYYHFKLSSKITVEKYFAIGFTILSFIIWSFFE